MFDDPRWGDDPRDRDEDPRDRHARSRHRDDDAGPHLGRGPSARGEKSEPGPRYRDDARWPERDRDPRGHDPRHRDPRDVFMRNLNLPRGREREIVHDPRERAYTLRGSETRTLSTVGAFRVVPASDLRAMSLRDHGRELGVEAQFFQNEELFVARRFDRLDASRPSRELAIQWAEEMRTWLRAGGQ